MTQVGEGADEHDRHDESGRREQCRSEVGAAPIAGVDEEPGDGGSGCSADQLTGAGPAEGLGGLTELHAGRGDREQHREGRCDADAREDQRAAQPEHVEHDHRERKAHRDDEQAASHRPRTDRDVSERETAGQAAHREHGQHDTGGEAAVLERRHHTDLDGRTGPDQQEADHGRQHHRGFEDDLPEGVAAARDAHAPDLGRQDEPCPAADEDDRDQDQPLARAHLSGDEGDHDRGEDPDDLLQRGVEREQGSELAGVHELRVDGAHRRLDRRGRESRHHPQRHVTGQVQRQQGEAEHGEHAHREGEGEHAAHAPVAHPSARDGTGDGLADTRRGEHETGGAVRAGLLLDVQQDRQGRHPVGEARGQLRRDHARHSGRAKKILISRHLTTVPAGCDGRRSGGVHDTPPTRRGPVSTGIRMSEVAPIVPPVDGSLTGVSQPRFLAVRDPFQGVSACGRNGGEPVLYLGRAVENYTDVTTSPCGHTQCPYLYVVLKSRRRTAGKP
ncbi:hypothetical protein SRABI76_01543 [Microbacterium oxydans]|nr:hypothetical protein SRABI76_01543 [Microbacterium oxydans]